MSNFPTVNPNLQAMSGRPYSKFAAEMKAMGAPKYPLHIGDTYLRPPQMAAIERVTVDAFPSAHTYTEPKGLPKLVQTIARQYDWDEACVQVTAGATGGLHICALTCMQPGDEVLILAPYWPLAAGIFRALGVKPVSVPFFGLEGDVTERIAPYVTEKTAGIYVNSPNNPTGLMLDGVEMRALAELARSLNLWIFADEVYERMVYEGTHHPLRKFAPERTCSIFSFSKAFGMAGYRCGFVLAPSVDVATEIQKAMVHSTYSVSTPAQIVACDVLETGTEWLSSACTRYADVGRQVASILGVEKPQSGTFLFVNIADLVNGRSVDDILRACIAEKLLLAPGSSFGDGYQDYIRLCFTSAPPEIVLEGVRVFKQILETN